MAASISCNLPALRRAEATPPPPPVPVTTEAVKQLEENIQAAAATAQSGGPVVLTISEAQITSYVHLQMQSIQEPKISDIQVHLRDGQVQIGGSVEQSGFLLPLEIKLTVAPTLSGGINYQVISATVGPLDLPQDTIDSLKSQLDASLLPSLAPQATNIIIQNITIADGLITISGQPRP